MDELVPQEFGGTSVLPYAGETKGNCCIL